MMGGKEYWEETIGAEWAIQVSLLQKGAYSAVTSSSVTLRCCRDLESCEFV